MPMFGTMKLVAIDASLIEAHLRNRLGQRRRVHRKAGVVELGIIKPTTVHQEFRVLRRIFSVALKKNVVLHIDWNQASIDSNRVCREGETPGEYVQWTPAGAAHLARCKATPRLPAVA